MTQSPPGADPGDPFNFPRQELHRDGGLLVEALAHMRASGELILGEGVRRFEQAFGSWLAAGSYPPAVIGVANGTDALELGWLLKRQESPEVLVGLATMLLWSSISFLLTRWSFQRARTSGLPAQKG